MLWPCPMSLQLALQRAQVTPCNLKTRSDACPAARPRKKHSPMHQCTLVQVTGSVQHDNVQQTREQLEKPDTTPLTIRTTMGKNTSLTSFFSIPSAQQQNTKFCAQEKLRQNKTRQEQTIRCATTQGRTRQDKTRRDKTNPLQPKALGCLEIFPVGINSNISGDNCL